LGHVNQVIQDNLYRTTKSSGIRNRG